MFLQQTQISIMRVTRHYWVASRVGVYEKARVLLPICNLVILYFVTHHNSNKMQDMFLFLDQISHCASRARHWRNDNVRMGTRPNTTQFIIMIWRDAGFLAINIWPRQFGNQGLEKDENMALFILLWKKRSLD